jgi:hypothetical protein
VDETYVKVGSSGAWVWVAVEPVHRYILGVYLSRHQNILVAKLFLKSLVEKYGKHVVYSDGGVWYPEACRTLGLEHRLHSDYSKSLMERANQYVKDRLEEFDDHYPCLKKNEAGKAVVACRCCTCSPCGDRRCIRILFLQFLSQLFSPVDWSGADNFITSIHSQLTYCLPRNINPNHYRNIQQQLNHHSVRFMYHFNFFSG